MRPSPNQRHHAARLRADRARKRQRALQMREQERREQERAARATPSRPPCVCPPGTGWCMSNCTPCSTLDPQSPCLRESS